MLALPTTQPPAAQPHTNTTTNTQALCSKAHEACALVAAHASSSTAQHPKALAALQELAAGTMQLAAAVCCEPEVALPMISAGSHAAAMDQLKGAVKALTNHLVAAVEATTTAQQQAQQAQMLLVPALSAAAQPLLHMALTTAGFMSAAAAAAASDNSSSQHAKMCSMSALNLSWTHLTRLLVAMPEGVRSQVLQAADLLRGLCCALQQLQAAVADLAVQPRSRCVRVGGGERPAGSMGWGVVRISATLHVLQLLHTHPARLCVPYTQAGGAREVLAAVSQPFHKCCLGGGSGGRHRPVARGHSARLCRPRQVWLRCRCAGHGQCH
jgi:hypothetical protein